MRRMPWVIYLWPGLPQLSLRGSWYALAVAVGAAALLNLALLGSFVWSELIASDLRRALWVALGVSWVAAAILSVVWGRRQGPGEQRDSAKDIFREAIEHYLKGNWFQAQRVLVGILRNNNRDLDARLMLATLFRHTGRLDEAAAQLDLLTRLEGAGKWELEIQRERELLAEARTDTRAEERSGPETNDPPARVMHAA